MNDDEERRIQIRAKLTAELLDAFDSRPNKDAQTYGLLITLAASASVIWSSGKPDTNIIILLGIFAMIIGGCIIIAGEISLATKIRRVNMRLLKCALKNIKFFRQKF